MLQRGWDLLTNCFVTLPGKSIARLPGTSETLAVQVKNCSACPEISACLRNWRTARHVK